MGRKTTGLELLLGSGVTERNMTMQKILDGFYWIFNTGWDIWCGLFAQLPYGDPYIAIVAAMVVIYMANNAINPNIQTY